MSSTRHAKDDSFHQSRYASSPEFERGLRASLVAQRCFLIDAPSDRELIWFIQYLSHQEGGLAAIARAIIEKYAGRIQTKTMASMGLRPGTICNADQVRKLRADFDIIEGDISPSQSFILKGEEHVSGMRPPVPLSPQLSDFESQSHYEDRRQESEQYPTSYPSEKIFGVCSDAAGAHFEKWLNEVCLDPGTPFSHGPWYFHEAIEVLREFKNDYEKNISAGAVVTALGQIVCEALDYTAYSHGLTLLQGEARTGKSHAGRTWCNQHPGRARFVEVPPGNDETGFFRALARGLGLGNFLNYKTTEILARLEPVLLTGDILLVLDEAQRLWPAGNPRYGFPGRLVRVMDWADKGVPIAMISTPQFFVSQKVAEKHGWNAAQLTGRIMHYKQLPANLSQADLLAVAKVALPGAAAVDHQAAAMYAMKSTRNLAAIESIAKRARYLAMKAAREAITSEDVRLAMRESVLPSDTKLNLALATGKTPRSAATVEANASSCAPRRDSSPLAPRPGCGPSPVLRPVDSLMPPPASARRGVEAALNGD